MNVLFEEDGAFKADNFAKIASNLKRQAIWTKILDWAGSKGGLTWSNGYGWEKGLLETIAKTDAAFAKSIVRPEGGTYDLESMAKELPAFGAENVAKIPDQLRSRRRRRVAWR